MFRGDPILTLEDAKGEAFECVNLNQGRYEFYIGAYPANTCIDEAVAFPVDHWYEVHYQVTKEDDGPRMVRVTFIE
jgi:hypothetical protein